MSQGQDMRQHALPGECFMSHIRNPFTIVLSVCLLPLLAVVALAQDSAPPAGVDTLQKPAPGKLETSAAQTYTSTVLLH
jgi:hypothetical protein